MIFIITSFFITIIIIFIFSSKFFSPIPYFPSNKKDLPLIIKALDLKNNQIVFDLGAGDGLVIFESAKKAYEKKLNTKFLAVEINPILILIMSIKRLFHPNKKNIKIIFADMFKMDFSKFIANDQKLTFYLYISPWYIKDIIKNLKLKIKNFSLVSYMYPVKFLKTKKNKFRIIQGKNRIFLYNL